MTSTSSISPRETSLVNLNQLIDELEFAITQDATPTVLALKKRIDQAGYEHFNLFHAKARSLTDTPEDFQAMFTETCACLISPVSGREPPHPNSHSSNVIGQLQLHNL